MVKVEAPHAIHFVGWTTINKSNIKGVHAPGTYVHVVEGAGAVVEPGAVSRNELPLLIEDRRFVQNRAEEGDRNSDVCDGKHVHRRRHREQGEGVSASRG